MLPPIATKADFPPAFVPTGTAIRWPAATAPGANSDTPRQPRGLRVAGPFSSPFGQRRGPAALRCNVRRDRALLEHD